uniref:Glycoside hydrolase family 47 protein n=1 Tax=Mycena chlorophos TaxID=658473 RepID=A0ABQ0MA82_MYCCL|nr:glycoside hydrolase family 47 protein [Mycena chlorophos]
MSSQVRQRKKAAKTTVPKPSKWQPEPEVSYTDFQGGLFMLVVLPPLLFVIGIAYFVAPQLFHDAFGAFFGFDESEIARIFPTGEPPEFLVDLPRRDAVVQAFQHAWGAYERDAMGADEYHPISHEGTNLTSAGGIGNIREPAPGYRIT